MEAAGKKRRERKARYKVLFESTIGQFKKCLVIGIDNVGSLQMQKVRRVLRGKAVMVMGKNTLIRMLIRENLAKYPHLEALLPAIKGNVGLIFTNEDMKSIRDIVVSFKVPAAARAGTKAANDVIVPPGATGLDPGQTGFFQALNVPTKISRGSIEIVNEVVLVKCGEKVTSSHVALLVKLDIKPFFYGLKVVSLYEEGSMYPATVLDISNADLLKRFFNGVSKLTALSLGANWPSALTLPHMVGGAFRKLMAISLATSWNFKESEEFLKAAKTAAEAPKPAETKKEDKKEEKKKEEKKEEKKAEEPAPEEDAVGGLGDMFG
jgi:large subunit ribosomal protein LP0